MLDKDEIRVFTSMDGFRKARVEYSDLYECWLVWYYAGGSSDTDYKGTNGTGCKLFSDSIKACRSAHYYITRR